ncbi:CDP-glycerol--glycerophosphate glycerophosphotransferase [Limosilactobacillus reuteri]|uniref:CDP-glycerol glycerophosphotransferase family protein n=1 Tax=Limosilactobacillus reuteri TaxID=1598 RepID=UPI00117CD668|nr:CDP-glycerol glycerophosphotransferase family protein [Limosilactobacillus reuteri]MCC4346851.1 CDP-glycerol glycerophosphotransferase family protein [Limosilactobacillus reuteri]MCT3203230.1 CDP-glycerol--glycerophosphate glycerophosphotransferase [Limosilactobacillus reuteri]MCT3211833.1 CDP-glycerol--glycerophosphate glycerophosphotransferase [Limosilactobacillus reuteri]TSB18833.1 CDP-glycerol--glycerophosphate glycerophosphotransferase [Limosilactobacillus reuteri]UAW61709.1 CDP-glycer
MLQKIKRIVKEKILRPLLLRKYAMLDINKNKIVVDNFYGKGYGDNPKYIINSLQKKRNDLDIVWLVDKPTSNFKGNIRQVPITSFKALKELSTAAVWIDNIRNFPKPPKRKNQFYLQTWHAGLGIKSSEAQIENLLSDDYIATVKEDAKKTNLMLSDSQWTTDIYSHYFWYDGEIIESGFPRNDILITKPKIIKDKIYNNFSIQKNYKIILYAPSFRDYENNMDAYRHDFFSILESAEQKFNQKYCVLIRLHPNISDEVKKNIEYRFDNHRIYDASNYPDMQELIVATDILITDYSSCMFDSMIARKKTFLLASDYKSFIQEDRKLLFDVQKDLPFSLSLTDEQLINNIKKFNMVNYLNSIKEFEKSVKLKEPGNASEIIADLILEYMFKLNIKR